MHISKARWDHMSNNITSSVQLYLQTSLTYYVDRISRITELFIRIDNTSNSMEMHESKIFTSRTTCKNTQNIYE